MFWALEELEDAGEIDDRQCSVARLAAWFHDAIYDPEAEPGSNEADSAVLARDTLQQLGIGDEDVDVIDRLIRLTAGHDRRWRRAARRGLSGRRPVDPVRAAGAVRRLLRAGSRGVRARAGRGIPAGSCGRSRAVLLHRDTIYRTSHALHAWETPARINLGRELARLRADL